MSVSLTGDPAFLRGLVQLGPRRLFGAAWLVALGRPRSLAQDAQIISNLFSAPPRAEGLENVPSYDAFVLVANHFQPPDLWVGWVAAVIADAVARARAQGGQDLHWLVTSQWRWFQVGRHWVSNPAAALLFTRASRIWGMIPTPAHPGDVAGRALALRQMLTYLGQRRSTPRPPQPVALFPEGKATLSLEEARAGTGAFLHRVSRLGVPLLPVGAYQEGKHLVVRFGEAFVLADPPAEERANLDGWARERVMVAIGQLLPPALWGAYAPAIARSVQADPSRR